MTSATPAVRLRISRRTAHRADTLALQAHALTALAVASTRLAGNEAATRDEALAAIEQATRDEALAAIEQAVRILPPLEMTKDGIGPAPSPGDPRLLPSASIREALSLLGNMHRIEEVNRSDKLVLYIPRPGAMGDEYGVLSAPAGEALAAAREGALHSIDSRSSDPSVRGEEYARVARALAFRGQRAEALIVAEKVIDVLTTTSETPGMTTTSETPGMKSMKRALSILASSNLVDPESVLKKVASLAVLKKVASLEEPCRAPALQFIAEVVADAGPADVARQLAVAAAEAYASLAVPLLEAPNSSSSHLTRAQGLARMARLLARLKDPEASVCSDLAQDAVEAVLEAGLNPKANSATQAAVNLLVSHRLYTLLPAAEISIEVGPTGRALEAADRCRTLLEEYSKRGPTNESAYLLIRLSNLYAGLGQEAEARRLALLALEATRSIDDRLAQSYLIIALARALARSGLYYQARRACEDYSPTPKMSAYLGILDEWQKRRTASPPGRGTRTRGGIRPSFLGDDRQNSA